MGIQHSLFIPLYLIGYLVTKTSSMQKSLTISSFQQKAYPFAKDHLMEADIFIHSMTGISYLKYFVPFGNRSTMYVDSIKLF